MPQPVIAATGLYVPPNSISNAELVGAFNAYVERFNADNATAIAAGQIAPLLPSSVEFIEKASGIKARYVMDKQGILDPAIMRPIIAERPNEQLSILAEMAVAAAEDALKKWGGDVSDIGAVICAASNMQRPYPAMSVEVQNALGIGGFAFDMNVACSSATFGIKTAADFISSGSVKAVLMVNPEICSGHLNFTRSRQSLHFRRCRNGRDPLSSRVGDRWLEHPRHAAQDEVFEQHSQQLRLSQSRGSGRHRREGQALRAGGP